MGAKGEILLLDLPSEPLVVLGAKRRVVVLPGKTEIEEQIRTAHRQLAKRDRSAAARKLARAQLEELVGKLPHIPA